MAGSLKYFNYTTDLGDDFAIFQDEDWGELMGNAAPAAETKYKLPGNVEPRYANYSSTSGKRTLQLIIGAADKDLTTVAKTITITASNGETAGNTDDDTLKLTSVVGERWKPITSGDTGLTDGDA